MKEVYSRLQSYMEAHKGEMHALWQRIVNIDSGSRNIEGVNKVCAILQDEMEKSGIRTRVIPMKNAGNVLIGEWNFDKSDKKPLVFIGHMDTVFPDGTVESNPFRVDEEGKVHGPGCLDMKGGDVIGLYVVKALASIGFTDRPIKFIYVGDEENLHMFSNAREIIQSEVRGALAAFNYETGYPDDRLVVGRKGGGIIEVTVHGIASHSGIAPEVGRSAIIEAAHKMIEIESHTDIPAGRLINCGLIQGGIGENTIPDTCTFKIGIRFPSVKVRDEILEIIQNAADHCTVPDTTADVKVIMLMDSMDNTDDVNKLFEHIRKVGEDCGYGKLGSFTISGVSDSGPAVSAGIPTVCAMGVRGEGNHTPKEYALLNSMEQRAYLAACAAYELPDDLFA